LHQYVVESGFTYRDDSPMVASVIPQYPETFSVRNPEYFEAVYLERPTIFELDHYPRVKEQGDWTAEPGSAIAAHVPGMTGPEFFLRALELLRASYIGYHGPAHEWLADNPELTIQALNRAGYWYFPHRVVVPDATRAGEWVELHIDWENRGVAPAYHDYDLVLQWDGPQSGSVSLPSGNRQWMPRSDGSVDSVAYSLHWPENLQPGEYQLKMKLYAPRVAETVRLGLDPSIEDADGFYQVASFRIID
jgi:hypothetical protein